MACPYAAYLAPAGQVLPGQAVDLAHGRRHGVARLTATADPVLVLVDGLNAAPALAIIGIGEFAREALGVIQPFLPRPYAPLLVARRQFCPLCGFHGRSA